MKEPQRKVLLRQAKFGDFKQTMQNAMYKLDNGIGAVISNMLHAGLSSVNNSAAEKPTFVREYIGGAYSIPAYFMSKAIVYLPINLAMSSIYSGISTLITGYQTPFFKITLTAYCMQDFGAAWGQLIGLNAPDAASAMQWLPLFVLPQMEASGIFGKLPDAFDWLKHLCGYRYTMLAYRLTEFRDQMSQTHIEAFRANPDVGHNPYNDYSNTEVVSDVPAWMTYGVLIGICLAYSVIVRVIGSVLLWWNMRRR